MFFGTGAGDKPEEAAKDYAFVLAESAEVVAFHR